MSGEVTVPWVCGAGGYGGGGGSEYLRGSYRVGWEEDSFTVNDVAV